ncbi:unnamed protein product [Symbiodinium sp. CCMP2592]|nr:unnamed protein product [Symbiodinium sp. CCMP2592]
MGIGWEVSNEVVLLAVSTSGTNLQLAAKEKGIARVLPEQGKALSSLFGFTGLSRGSNNELKDDPEVVQAAIKFDGLSLQFASERLRADRDMVLAAVSQNGCALEFASEALRQEREVVWQAVNRTPRSLALALGGLADDEELEELARDVRCRIQETGR